MNNVLNATYEGRGILRLDHELRDVHPLDKVQVMVLNRPQKSQFAVEEIDLEGVRQELAVFERQYDIPSAEFYRRYRQGEMGDAGDFIVWAGMYQIMLRLSIAADNT
jgi:hypothetical protein